LVRYGRRTTIILGCLIFIVGVILQTASSGLGLLVAGRLVAGFGVGFGKLILIDSFHGNLLEQKCGSICEEIVKRS